MRSKKCDPKQSQKCEECEFPKVWRGMCRHCPLSIEPWLKDIAADLVRADFPKARDWFHMERRGEVVANLKGPIYEFCRRLLYLDAELREFGETPHRLSALERSGIRILRQERNRLLSMREK